MKKILVALVVLALAGGGAFAQGWTFNGLVDGGVGIFITEDGDDDARLLPVGSRYGTAGVRAQLETRFTNADGNAGLFLRIRQDNPTAGAHSAAGEGATRFHAAHGWMNLMDDMFTIYGGLVEHGYFNTLDRMTNGVDMGEGVGLSLIVRPMDNLTLGFGAFGHHGRSLSLTDDELDGQAKFTVGASFVEPDLFQVRVGFRNTNEANGFGWDNWNVGAPGPRTGQGSLLYLSFAYLDLEDIHVAATVGLQNLEEFGDEGALRVYASFGHTGLVENMDLRAGIGLGLPMWDSTATRGDDMHLWVMLSAAYTLSDMLVPRVDIHYVTGGTAGNVTNMNHDQMRNSATWDSENSFLQFRPAMQIRAASNAWLEVGCVINIDLGDNNTFGGDPAFTTNNGTNFGVFALVRMNF